MQLSDVLATGSLGVGSESGTRTIRRRLLRPGTHALGLR